MELIFITIPLGLLQEPFTKVAISLPEIVQQTNAFSVKRRPGCTPSLLDSDPKQLFLHYNVKCHEDYSDPAGHDVRVQFDVSKVEQTQMAKDLDVQVNCSCPAFLYWGAQWNLHQRDGLYGEPRPLLQAPTERLDLRGNFVICKHIKAVFERILPSVQHNIVKILRERTVEKNKQRVEEERGQQKPKLRERQEEMRKRKELEKVRKTKNKEIQEKLLEALRQREEEKLMKEQGVEEEAEVGRTESATAPAPVVETPKKEDVTLEEPPNAHAPDDISDLLDAEEKKLREQEHRKVKNKPHLHKGLPYETDTEKKEHGHKVPSDRDLLLKMKQKPETGMKDFVNQKMKRKRTSLELDMLAALAEVDDESGD